MLCPATSREATDGEAERHPNPSCFRAVERSGRGMRGPDGETVLCRPGHSDGQVSDGQVSIWSMIGENRIIGASLRAKRSNPSPSGKMASGKMDCVSRAFVEGAPLLARTSAGQFDAITL